jgi:hypothetical protein
MSPDEVGPPGTTPEDIDTSTSSTTDTDKSSGGERQGEDGQLADLIDYFEACGFGDQSGWLVIRWGRNPYIGKNRTYRHGDGQEFFLRWPEEAEGTLLAIVEMAAVGDVYVCPYLRRTAEGRNKGDAVSLRLVHCDVDIYVDPARVTDLGGFAINSGTPGHAHVYVPFTRPVIVAHHEVLAKGMIHHLGADKGKWSDNDVLRPPGTFNYKPTVFDNLPPAPVTWLVRP